MKLKYSLVIIFGALLCVLSFILTFNLLIPESKTHDGHFFDYEIVNNQVNTLNASRYDDGQIIPAGAWKTVPRKVVITHRHPYPRVSWWVRGPVRRFISWPVRVFINRRRCR